MTTVARPAVPRRDEAGRVVSLPEMVAVAAGYAAVNAVGLVLIDGLLTLLRLGTFGRSSGWLVLILPALLYFDDFRAWKASRAPRNSRRTCSGSRCVGVPPPQWCCTTGRAQPTDSRSCASSRSTASR